MEPLEIYHAIIDAEAEYHGQHGHAPHVLKLPRRQANDLAKLRRNEIGPLSGEVMLHGTKAFEEHGLLGIPVELVPGPDGFVFE